MNTAAESGDPGAGAEEHDAIVVGSGLGSLAAAIRLTAGGLRPLLLESSDLVGGASAVSGGVLWAPDNHLMRAAGLADSVEEGVEHLEGVSLGRGDAAIARAYVERLPAILETLEAETALELATYPGLPDYFAEIPGGKADGRCLLARTGEVSAALEAARERFPELDLVRPSVHFPAEGRPWAAGRALVGCLWLRVLEDGTAHRLGARAVSLLREGGRVVGVEVEEAGARRPLRARHGVLLGSGGFEWNERMTRESVPEPASIHPQTPPISNGDGQRMAAALGAEGALMDQTIAITGIRVPGERNEDRPLCRIFFQELTYSHSLLVNQAGRRFADESFFPDLVRACREGDAAGRPNLPMFFVFDRQYVSRHGLPGSLEVGPHLTEHPDLEALAADRGIDAAGLKAQVERLNAAVAAGRDAEFGRGESAYRRAFAGPESDGGNPTLGTVAEPPFYSLEVFLGTSGSRGGVVCDTSGRVLDVRGEAIEGLYACGSVAAGLATGATYLSGTSHGAALVFGTAAAEAILATAAASE